MKYKESKFLFNSETFELLEGKFPTKDGQLWKGEDHNGDKMEFAGNSREPNNPTAYWGWSNDK